MRWNSAVWRARSQRKLVLHPCSQPFRFRYFEVFQDACAMKVRKSAVDVCVGWRGWRVHTRLLHGRPYVSQS